jgi:hypothetical protein
MRAVHNLESIQLSCKVFLETNPYGVFAEFEPEVGCHVIRLSIREEPPLLISAVVGEIIHNLRSALDQAAWVVACRSNPVEYLWQPNIAEQIAFPLTEEPAKFEVHKIMPFIAEDAKAIFDDSQPYQGTERAEAFAWLNVYWNIDKHRVVHPGFGLIDFSGAQYVPHGIFIEQLDTELIDMLDEGVPLEDDTPIALIFFGDSPEGIDQGETTYVDVTETPTAEIVFGSAGAGWTIRIDDLGLLIAHVAEALSEIQTLDAHAPPSKSARRWLRKQAQLSL